MDLVYVYRIKSLLFMILPYHLQRLQGGYPTFGLHSAASIGQITGAMSKLGEGSESSALRFTNSTALVLLPQVSLVSSFRCLAGPVAFPPKLYLFILVLHRLLFHQM